MPAKEKHVPREGVVSSRWVTVVRVFVVAAFLIGSYLLSISLRGVSAVGCGPESGCDKVLHSRWAYLFGIPVSLFALAIYGLTFITTLRLKPKAPIPAQKQAWRVLVLSAMLMIGAGLWFFYLQVGVIHAICPFCMAAHGSGMVASVLILLAAPFGPAPEKKWQQEKHVFIPVRVLRNLALLAVIGLAGMVLGQTLHSRKTYVVTALPGVTNVSPPTTVGTPAPRGTIMFTNPALRAESKIKPGMQSNVTAPQATKAAAMPPTTPQPLPPNPNRGRAFIVYGTNILDLQQVPVVGLPDAPYMIVSLYDYTCHHCKEMHEPLMQLTRTFPSDLGIISLPMPLDPACNHTVKRASGPAATACELARISLAVWRADRSKMRQFDDFMFAPKTPPSPEEARVYATQLVGANQFGPGNGGSVG